VETKVLPCSGESTVGGSRKEVELKVAMIELCITRESDGKERRMQLGTNMACAIEKF
jgi:hypothetical protein